MIILNGKHYVYRHIRLDKYEPFYIGIGTKDSIKKWKSNYKRSYDKKYRNDLWKKIYNKTSYKIEILIESNDYEFIKEKEKYFIKLYGRKDLGTGTLCNLTDGGEGGLNCLKTEEIKLKISNKLKGRKVPIETLMKRVKGIKKNKDSPGYKRLKDKLSKKVIQLDKNFNPIKEWDSITEAGKNGFQISKISLCCNNKRPFHKGYIWKFK